MNEDRLNSLLLAWQEKQLGGQDLPATELCRDCPELAEELNQRIQVLRQMNVLMQADASLTTPCAPAAVLDTPADNCQTGFGSVDTATVPCLPELAGRFRLLGEIAHGGMGSVLRGHDPELGRDLAVKVVLPVHRNDPSILRRFLDEARLAGQLQHPGVAPVYDLGRLTDGRPFFAMKLIEGRTLDELLRRRTSPAHELPRFLKYFEAVCQTVGYAHARDILHRDLKPLNVMVGAFGEVQVMDWGLAKVLQREPTASDSTPVRVADLYADGAASQAGSVVGTPGYMAPEQARGETERLDLRSDVFGLGAILCEILTGRPPFSGPKLMDVLMQSAAGNLSDAHARLDTCGADAELVRLAKACLAAERDERPADGGAVAEGMAGYLSGVQDRLRRAEVAQAQAEAERKRRRAQLGLTVALLVLVLVGGGGAWLFQQQRQTADAAATRAMAEARWLLEQARADPLKEGGRFQEALAAARKAEELAQTGAASGDVRRQAGELSEMIGGEEGAARRDRRLLAELLEVRGPREGPTFRRDEGGLVTKLAEPSADDQFVSAFRTWGLDVDTTPTVEAAARLRERPLAVRTEVIAALDEWARERRRQPAPAATGQRLTDLAEALDEPDSRRRELRAIVARGNLARERAVGALMMALRPVPVPFDAGPGEDRGRLRQLAAETDAATEPVLGLLTLTSALHAAGEEILADGLLRAALRARPQEVVLHQTLGLMLEQKTPPLWGEVVECYSAARALRPSLGDSLADALIQAGRGEDGLALYERLAVENPRNPWLHARRGTALHRQGRQSQAEAAYREALRLQADFAQVHYNLGVVLQALHKHQEAVTAYREALRLQPDDLNAQNNLGAGLFDQRRFQEAESAFRRASRLRPEEPLFQRNLGHALNAQGRAREAETAFRIALRLDSDYVEAYSGLSDALRDQDQLAEAEAAIREAIRLKPDVARAHLSLGVILRRQRRFPEAEAACRLALRLQPDYADAHNILGNALSSQGQHVKAETAYRDAIRFDPRFAEAHNNLALALLQQGRLSEAEAAFREAIQHDADLPRPRINLARLLLDQGRFVEALEWMRRGHALGMKQAGWQYPSADWVHDAERLVELDRRLPAIVSGDAEPATVVESLEFVVLCQHRARRLHTAAARLAITVFAAEPKLATDLQQQLRYNAACSAALAAVGQAEDAKDLPDKVAATLRRQALQWLRADLTLYAKLAERGDAATKTLVQQRLTHWQTDPDLAGVRNKDTLANLADAERDAWHQLWADVEAVRKRAVAAK